MRNTNPVPSSPPQASQQPRFQPSCGHSIQTRPYTTNIAHWNTTDPINTRSASPVRRCCCPRSHPEAQTVPTSSIEHFSCVRLNLVQNDPGPHIWKSSDCCSPDQSVLGCSVNFARCGSVNLICRRICEPIIVHVNFTWSTICPTYFTDYIKTSFTDVHTLLLSNLTRTA